jgi:putative oxidoreductase
MKIPFTLGRLLYGGFFLTSGIHHFRDYKKLSAYAESKGIPHLLAPVVVMGSGALLVAGGASLLLGAKPKLGSAAVITFLAGVSPVMHNFWRQHGEARENDMAHFMKNSALLGGALALAGVEEPWPVSLPIGAATKFFTPRKDAAPRAA